MFACKEEFTKYTPIAMLHGSTANDGPFNIIRRGKVVKEVVLNRKRNSITLLNVTHAPSLANNLISLGKLDRSGYKATIGEGEINLQDRKGVAFMKGRLNDNNIYEVEFTL